MPDQGANSEKEACSRQLKKEFFAIRHPNWLKD
jgi:hypothetical protein